MINIVTKIVPKQFKVNAMPIPHFRCFFGGTGAPVHPITKI